jgi:hypothetical protein
MSDVPNAHAESTSDNADPTDEKGDIETVVDDVKEAVAEKAEKIIGQQGKDATAKPEYAPNGYAHAPHWPLVSLSEAVIHD